MSTSSKAKAPRIKTTHTKPPKEKKPVVIESVESEPEEPVVKLRPFFVEKGFKYGSGVNWGLTAAFKNQIDALNWKSFAEHRQGYVANMVREFYDLVSAPNQTFIILRGGKVNFDASDINNLYDLEDVEDEYAAALDNLTAAQLNSIKKELTMPGSEWIKSSEGQLKILRNQLKHQPKVWYHFLRHTLYPTAHNETVDQDRLVLLHCIIRAKKINVGALLRNQIIKCAKKETSNLLFPCLITQLCLDQRIDVFKDEGVEEAKGPIDLLCIQRMKPVMEKSEDQPPESSRKGKESVKKDPEDNEFAQKLTLLMLQHMTEQQELWTFLYRKHTWDLQNFKVNNWSHAAPIPEFPKHILKSLQQEEGNVPTDKTPAASVFKTPSAPKQQPAQSEDKESTTSSPDVLKTPVPTPPKEKASASTPAAKKSKRKASESPSLSLAPQHSSAKSKRSKLMDLAETIAEEETAGSKKKTAKKAEVEEEEEEQDKENVIAEEGQEEEDELEEEEQEEEEVQIISSSKKKKTAGKTSPPTRKSKRNK